MSFQEKRTMVTILTTILILGAYCMKAYEQYRLSAMATADIKFWAGTTLGFIGVSIVIAVMIQIVFHVLFSVSIAVQKKRQNDKCEDREIERAVGIEMATDEMEKLIELKSMRVGFGMVGIGFVLSLVSQILDYGPGVMVNMMFGSFCIGMLLQGITKLYYYRRGI
jgi:hypothetical protein